MDSILSGLIGSEASSWILAFSFSYGFSFSKILAEFVGELNQTFLAFPISWEFCWLVFVLLYKNDW